MATHYLVDDKLAGASGVFVGNILEENRSLLSCRPRTERLSDGSHIVVHSLRQTHYSQIVTFFRQMSRKCSCHGIGIITTHGVEDGNVIFN